MNSVIRTMTLDYPTGPDARLDYEGNSGGISVEGGASDKVTVRVVAQLPEDGDEDAETMLQRIVDGIRHSGDTVRITTPQITVTGPWYFISRGVRVDYTVTVPWQTACRLNGRNGRVEVLRVGGPVEVGQRSGRTTVRIVEGDVQVAGRSGAIEVEEVEGDVLVRGHSGRVSVRRVNGDLRVQCHSGAVRADEVTGDVVIASHSGRIVAMHITGAARIESASGRILLGESRGAARLRSTSGAIRFQGPVLGNLDIATTSGGIQLDVDPERPFFIDAETVSGSLRSDLTPRRHGPPPAADAAKVRLRTVSGAIRIGRFRSLSLDQEVAADAGPDDDDGPRGGIAVAVQRTADRQQAVADLPTPPAPPAPPIPPPPEPWL